MASGGCSEDSEEGRSRDGRPAQPAGETQGQPTPERAAKECLEGHGVRTTLRRRKPGDEDAPDAELLFGEPTPQAIIALYRDVRRARLYLPQIRKNAEAFDGIVERRGGVTIVWIDRPSPRVRAEVQECVWSKP
jgi:hypothetical protein